MITRCENPNQPHYDRYGGRGVKVCERWRNSFESFLEDMGEPPPGRHSIDRFPDKDGNYEPGNCRWATDTEQARNRSDNRLLTHDGATHTAIEWAEITGIHVQTILHRLRVGWSESDALTKPPKQGTTYTHEGVTRTIYEWAAIHGMSPMTLTHRIRKGWTADRVFSKDRQYSHPSK